MNTPFTTALEELCKEHGADISDLKIIVDAPKSPMIIAHSSNPEDHPAMQREDHIEGLALLKAGEPLPEGVYARLGYVVYLNITKSDKQPELAL